MLRVLRVEEEMAYGQMLLSSLCSLGTAHPHSHSPSSFSQMPAAVSTLYQWWHMQPASGSLHVPLGLLR